MDGLTLFDFSGPSSSLPVKLPRRHTLAPPSLSPAPPARRAPHTVSVLSEAEYSMLMESAPASGTSGPLAAAIGEEDEAIAASEQTLDDDGELMAEDAARGTDDDEDIVMMVVEAVKPALAPCSAVMVGSDVEAELDRAKVVELILGINKTVAVEYLEQFKDRSLRNYLAHLETTAQPRGRGSRWERRGDSPALVVHESAL